MSVIDYKGDIFMSSQPVIGHGVNTVGVMGSGIAKDVKALYPGVYDVYNKLCKVTPVEKLKGKSLIIKVADFDGTYKGQNVNAEERFIANIFSQIATGADARLDLLEDGVRSAYNQVISRGLSGIAFPRIGAGIGGLKWDEVRAVLEKVAAEYPEVETELWEFVA